jgi:hypothetical protein
MPSLPCDIVLLPNEELAQKAISGSRLLASYDALFTLEMGKFYPHMSLYMFQLNESDIPKVEIALKGIAALSQTILGKATRYFLGEGFGVGYIDPEYEVTEELSSLQHGVIEAINPLRAGMRESDIIKMQDATGEKLENLKTYGYPAVGTLFRPHMTLTRLKAHTPEALDVLPDSNTFTGAFDRIGLFEMGTNGTCIRQLAVFDLPS